jgi:glycosyltransferase involved in cell wall biosynthesis
LIYLGRFGPEKNLPYLLDVIGEVCQVIPDLRACIVGGRGDVSGLVRAAELRQLQSNVVFVGITRDASRYYAASKVYCLTSLYEGLPIAPLEAMLHGLPVVTTAYPGADELVIQGKTGYVCRSKQEYVARVLELLTDAGRWHQMGALAREHVQRCHGRASLEHFVRAALDNYTE